MNNENYINQMGASMIDPEDPTIGDWIDKSMFDKFEDWQRDVIGKIVALGKSYTGFVVSYRSRDNMGLVMRGRVDPFFMARLALAIDQNFDIVPVGNMLYQMQFYNNLANRAIGDYWRGVIAQGLTQPIAAADLHSVMVYREVYNDLR
jgi:hypothetical protein